MQTRVLYIAFFVFEDLLKAFLAKDLLSFAPSGSSLSFALVGTVEPSPVSGSKGC